MGYLYKSISEEILDLRSFPYKWTSIRPLLMTYLFQLHRPRQKSLPHEYCHYCHYYLIILVSLIFYLCLNKGVVILSLICNSSPLI